MKDFNNIVIVYPEDPTIDFLKPICELLLNLYPKAELFRPLPSNYGATITDETDLLIFLGHGTPSKLLGNADLNGDNTVFLDVPNGALLLNNLAVILFSCNSYDYLKKIRKISSINYFLTFGDMPTDWKHIIHNRDLDPDYLNGIKDEHLDYYKQSLVESIVAGLKNGIKTNSVDGIYKRIHLIINKKINEIILSQPWDVNLKHKMIELFTEFKNEIRYAQPL
jgi:hypothetical protein